MYDAPSNTYTQILRYGALAFGIFYGITHRSALQSSAAKAEEQHEYQRKSDLITKAKAEWTKKTMPPESKTQGGGGELLSRIKSEKKTPVRTASARCT